MKKSYLFLASLSCFSLLGAAGPYYVTSSTQGDTVPSTCASECGTSTNTCCQFLDALNEAQESGSSSAVTINLIASSITYEASSSIGYSAVQTVPVILFSSGGTVIDFNGASTTASGGYVFSTDTSGSVDLQNVVFQNASETYPISMSGSNTFIRGTVIDIGGESVSFSGNFWHVATSSGGSDGGLYFEPGDYSSPFSDTLIFDNTGSDTFYLVNQSNGPITFTGDVITSSGGSSTLHLDPTSGSMVMTGSLNINHNLFIEGGGSVWITPSSGSANPITDTVIIQGDASLYINSANSLGTSATVNFRTLGELNFISSFSFTNPIVINSSTSAILNDNGYNVTVGSSISGAGDLLKTGSGTIVLTESNSYTGQTFVEAGVLSISNPDQISSSTLNLQTGGSVFASQSLTLPNAISIASSGGGLFADAASTLTVSGAITALGDLLVGNSLQDSGIVALTNTANSFSNSITIGSSSFAASLSANSATLGGLTGLTLQGGGSFAPSSTTSLSVPVTIGPSGGVFSLVSGDLTLSGSFALDSLADFGTTVSIDGGGNLSLEGDNSNFQGNWLVLSGSALEVQNSSNVGADVSTLGITLEDASELMITGSMASERFIALNGTSIIEVTSSNTASFTGNVSIENSSVNLLKTGTGTLCLLPASASSVTNFSMDIEEGQVTGNTLWLENTNIIIGSGAFLEFSQSSPGTFSGSITGAGGVIIEGSSSLIFAPASSSYTGGTSFSGTLVISQDVLGDPSSVLVGEGGTLQTTSSFTLARSISLETATITAFSPNSSTILQLSGNIEGSGGLSKEGAGILVITSDASYTGKTYVNQGALVVNGDISASGDPIVGSNTLLAGTGTIGTADVFGILKGGDPLGTLTVTGDLILEEGSSFGTALSSSSVSLVDVSGSVTIDPSSSYLLVVTPGSYNLYSDPVVVLEASDITGEFTEVGGAATVFLGTTLSYTPTEVLLQFVPRSIESLATGQNAINTATGLDSAIAYNRSLTYSIDPGGISASSSPELPLVLASLLPYTTSSEMTYALNQLHPAQMKAMAISQENNAMQVELSLYQRMKNLLDVAPCQTKEEGKKKVTTWVSGLGGSLSQDNEYNAWGPLTGYRINTGGVTLGVDARFVKNFYAGALGSYTHSHLHWKQSKGTGDISSGYAGLYLSGLGKLFYGNLSVIGSWSEYSAHRKIIYGSIDKTAENSHGGSQILAHLDTGINARCWGLNIRPFDSLDYMNQMENGYQEHGAGQWDLSLKKVNAVLLRNELGVEFAKCYRFTHGKWTISPKFSWVREVRTKGEDTTVQFAQGGSAFSIRGYFPDRSLFSSGLLFSGLMLEDRLGFNLYYNGEFCSGYNASNYGGQIRYSF
jgi:autotransporter-associated beta strand protein